MSAASCGQEEAFAKDGLFIDITLMVLLYRWEIRALDSVVGPVVAMILLPRTSLP